MDQVTKTFRLSTLGLQIYKILAHLFLEEVHYQSEALHHNKVEYVNNTILSILEG